MNWSRYDERNVSFSLPSFEECFLELLSELGSVMGEPVGEDGSFDWVAAAAAAVALALVAAALPVLSNGRNSGVSFLYCERILSFMME